jgi:F0F1-type ATP synthase assembly protein I
VAFFLTRLTGDAVTTGYLADARRGAFRVLVFQFLVALLAGGLGLVASGKATGVAALLGGLVGTAANLAMTWWAFGGKPERDPQRFLLRMMIGELSKFGVAVALFIVAISVFKAGFLPLMFGYFASLVAYWVGLLKSSIGQMR